MLIDEKQNGKSQIILVWFKNIVIRLSNCQSFGRIPIYTDIRLLNITHLRLDFALNNKRLLSFNCVLWIPGLILAGNERGRHASAKESGPHIPKNCGSLGGLYESIYLQIMFSKLSNWISPKLKGCIFKLTSYKY